MMGVFRCRPVWRGEAPPPRDADPRRSPRGRSSSAPATPGTQSASYAGRARLPVRRLYDAPQQFGRLSEVARRPVCVCQGIGCLCLHGALAEFGRQLDGLPACRNGAVEVSRDLRTAVIWASTRPSRARSSSARARASASLNKARSRLYSPSRNRGLPNARRSSMASILVSPSSGRCARAWRACSKAATASRNAARS